MTRLSPYAFCLDERIATQPTFAKDLLGGVIHDPHPGKVGKP